MDDEGLLTIKDAAQRVGKTTETIRAWIRRGRVTDRMVDGQQYVIATTVFAAAGMSYMNDIYELQRAVQALQEQVRVHERIIGAHEQSIQDLRANLSTTVDDFTTARGIRLFLMRHGMTDRVLRKLASSDSNFPVSHTADEVLTYAQKYQAQRSRVRGRRMRDLHRCSQADCACHTHEPPLPPWTLLSDDLHIT
jgi:hypothetical protein